MLSTNDWIAIGLTLELATTVTVVLLLIGTPLAWWLAHTRSWWRRPISAVVALPIVLPPTVIGFYVLVALGPNGPVGASRAKHIRVSPAVCRCGFSPSAP